MHSFIYSENVFAAFVFDELGCSSCKISIILLHRLSKCNTCFV